MENIEIQMSNSEDNQVVQENPESNQSQILDFSQQIQEISGRYRGQLEDIALNYALKLKVGDDVYDLDILKQKIDRSQIEIDGSGNIISGFDNQIDNLKNQFHFLFKSKSVCDAQFKSVVPAETLNPSEFSYSANRSAHNISNIDF